MKYLLALDLETTGLEPSYNEIIELAAILIDQDFNEVSRFSSYVKPRWPDRGLKGSFNVYEYTGIDRAVIEQAPRPEAILNNFEDWISSNVLFKNVQFFGQNVKFDYDFLHEEYNRQYKKFPFDYHIISLESLFFARSVIFDNRFPEKLTLKYMCDDLGVINNKPHSAISDIETTVLIAKRIIKSLR